MTDNTIHIVGLGVSETAEFSGPTKNALQGAQLVMGSARQLATVDGLLLATQRRIALPKLAELQDLIKQHGDASIAVLASGDPLHYGIGRWFSQHFERERLQFHPAVSSLQATCHRLGVSLQDVTVLSLHGRPSVSIRRQLRRQSQLLVLTDQNSQPPRLAKECIDAGFPQSALTVCENLGYRNEKISRFTAQELMRNPQDFDPLHVTYIEVLGRGGIQPEFPGIPDEHFVTGEAPGKGMISKREVRLAILSLMQVAKDDVVWDVGAGCGGVAVELALWQPHARIYAVEFHRERLSYLKQNREHFGVVSNLQVVEGRAPAALVDLPAANKVFVGGSDGELVKLLTQIWQQLPVWGAVVASAVVDSSKQKLRQFAMDADFAQVECLELSVKRGQLAAGDFQYNAKRPVEIFKFTKLANSAGQGEI